MEPKFQSSFIPKGPLSSSSGQSFKPLRGEKNLLGFLATLVFGIAALLALGVFGYKMYLNYSIKKMTAELENARSTLEPETVTQILELNNRLNYTGELIGNHTVLSPLFDFLQASTLKTVRFTSLNYEMTQSGLRLRMNGQARGYEALALQSEAFEKSNFLKKPLFSNLSLDDRGNILFSMEAQVDPTLLSYKRLIEKLPSPLKATTTATTTRATTTPR